MSTNEVNHQSNREICVYYTGTESKHPRKWSSLEKYLIAICILLFIASVSFIVIAFTRERRNNQLEYCLTDHCIRTAAQLLESIDSTADPCDDFYQFACGAWSKKYIIPEDKSSYDTFEKLQDQLLGKLKKLLEEGPGSFDTNATLKAKVLYQSCINTSQIEKVGDDPVKRVLDDFGGWPVMDPAWSGDAVSWSLEGVLAKLRGSLNTGLLVRCLVDVDDKNSSARVIQRDTYVVVGQVERVGDAPLLKVLDGLGSWPVVTAGWKGHNWRIEVAMAQLRGLYNAPILVDSWVAADDKNSSLHILQLDQPSLGMPSREYYLKEHDLLAKEAYLRYMTNMAILLGAPHEDATNDMAEVMEFETELANVTTPQAERHDTGARYTKLTVRELQRQVPEVDWLAYFNGFMPVVIKEDEQIVSFAMDYLKDMAKLVKRQKKRVLANYMLWRLILGLAPEMTEKFQRERNEYRKVLQGISRDKVRWQKCVKYVNERMGMSLGRLFIRDNFRRESKHVALEMIHNIREAFNEILKESDWMDEETKAVAKEKAMAMNERIGYPEFILDADLLDKKYSGLDFSPTTYFDNILKVEKHDSTVNLKKLREPVRKDEWDQDPAVVNAFYNPNTNDIVFPAAILQPLFYDEHFPKSLNYGGIGVVIGHEITHGFDDKGRQYDKDGILRQWWNNETISAFRGRAQCMIDQYNQYILEPFGYKINGKNTQGENIADNGGLKESYRAYRKWVSLNGEEPPLPGINLTHNQLFFLNYAQIWCGIMRDEEALHKIRTSVHSPGPIRVLGPLSNSKEFAEAYSCPMGSRMNPVKKCAVW